jgi:glycosyltransferase involved in cell wall biosynthesis
MRAAQDLSHDRAGINDMRVVIYEPDPTGHHFAYVSHVVEPLADLASEVILLTSPKAAASREFEQHLRPHAKRFSIDTVPERPHKRSAASLWKKFAELRQAVNRLRPDHLYVAYGDYLVHVSALDRMLRRSWPESTQCEVLLLRGGFQYPPQNLTNRLLNYISPGLVRRGPWNWIHHLNPDDLQVLKGNDGNCADRFSLMPDPVDPPSPLSKRAARRAMGVPEDGRYVGCAGVINRPKGADRLIGAFRAAQADLQSDDRLLLAGPLEEGFRSDVAREYADDISRGRIVMIDRLLSGHEIGTAVAAMDVVSTPYPWHLHSSNIVIRAAAGSRPVIGNSIGWMNRTIPQFDLGAVCDVNDQDAFRRTLVTTLNQSAGYQLTPAAQRFVEFHSAENFARQWTKRLRQRIGLPADEMLISWDDVIDDQRERPKQHV